MHCSQRSWTFVFNQINKLCYFHRRPFTYGLSSVLRRLKGGRVRVVILSADLKPRYVINQIILLALARNVTITILCVPNLEQEMKSLLDFQCFAFAINDSDSSELHKLFEWCQIVTSERHPVPKLIREYFRTRQQTSSAIDSIPMEMDNALAQRSTNVERSLRDLHLIRSSTAPEQRAFIPKNAISFKPLSFDVTSLDKIKSDFISLDAFDSDDSRTINPLQLPPSTSQEGEKRSAKFRPTHVKEAMKGEQRYQSAKIKRYAGKPEKKENDGKVKLSRKEKKELKKAMKTAKKNKQIS